MMRSFSSNIGKPSTVKMVSSGWQQQSKLATSYHCICGFCMFWTIYRNSHRLGRHQFSTTVRTKRGRILTCWTSHEIQGYVPINLARNRPTLTVAQNPAYFDWNNWRKPQKKERCMSSKPGRNVRSALLHVTLHSCQVAPIFCPILLTTHLKFSNNTEALSRLSFQDKIDQYSTCTLFFYSHTFVMYAEGGFALSCWVIYLTFLGKDAILKAAYVLLEHLFTLLYYCCHHRSLNDLH